MPYLCLLLEVFSSALFVLLLQVILMPYLFAVVGVF